MIRLKALKGHNYGGKYHKKGTTYKASDRHARLLVTIGKAEPYFEPPPPPPAPEPPKPTPRRRSPAKTASTYQTRQLKAEDSDE